MSDWTTIGTLALGLAAVVFIGRRALGSRTPHPLPPRPPGTPLIGNVTGIDPDAPWKSYAEWAKKYGDLIYIQVFGQDIIIINSEKVATDLLENRSTNYSDRPHSILNEMIGVDFSSIVLPYGDRWRLHRRFYHQTFRPEVVHRLLPYQDRRACHLLQRLFDAPQQLKDHVFEFAASVILKGAYDYDSTSPNDELIDNAANVIKIAFSILTPERGAIIGAFPWLIYLPSWFPGMSFKKQIAVVRERVKLHLERPFQYSLQKVPNDSATPSMVHDALRQLEEKGVSPDETWMKTLKEVSAGAFLAASVTPTSVLMTFFLMMVVNPGVQEKAQAHIDAVVGKDRLPTINDRPSLPFIDAILRETIRSHPAAPLSFPHVSTNDDVYNGYRIPKGTMFLANLWSMSHDESRFPNPHEFLPERFINDDGSLKPNDIEHISFGFGRRGCPGRYLADPSVWLAMVKVLAVFKILKPLDENGVEVPVEPKFQNAAVVSPVPFKCRIVPRRTGMDAKDLEQLIAVSTP